MQATGIGAQGCDRVAPLLFCVAMPKHLLTGTCNSGGHVEKARPLASYWSLTFETRQSDGKIIEDLTVSVQIGTPAPRSLRPCGRYGSRYGPAAKTMFVVVSGRSQSTLSVMTARCTQKPK